MFDVIMALILTIAVEVGVPSQFVLATALIENPTLDPLAISAVNRNGSRDYGVLQINGNYMAGFVNDYWDKPWEFDWRTPYDNIYLACRHIKHLMTLAGVNTLYAISIAYNAGYSRLRSPPDSTVEYAVRVMEKYMELTNHRGWTVIRGNR